MTSKREEEVDRGPECCCAQEGGGNGEGVKVNTAFIKPEGKKEKRKEAMRTGVVSGRVQGMFQLPFSFFAGGGEKKRGGQQTG